MKNNVIVKSNKLLNYGYNLSLNEQRLLLACISMVDSREKLEHITVFSISVQKIADLFVDEDAKHLYKDLKQACDRLFNRRIVYNDGSDDVYLRWVYKATYSKRESKITLSFSPDVIPYLSEIRSHFTKYKLQDVCKFRCVHSFRIYELLAQYQSIGTREISIDEFRKLLDLENKYPSYGELKRSVIDKAISEINQFSNFKVDYGTRTVRRKVTGLQFKFEIKKKTENLSSKQQRKITIEQFVQDNPVLTRGKTTQEVLNLMVGRK